MKKLFILIVLVLSSSILWASPDYKPFVIKVDNYNMVAYKYCFNNNDIFIIGRSTNVLPGETDITDDIMILKFRYENNELKYLWQKFYNSDLNCDILPTSIVYPNESGGFNLLSIMIDYHNQSTKFFSFDSECNLINENVDTTSIFDPLFKGPTSPLIINNDHSFDNIYFNTNKKSEYEYNLVALHYDSLADYISKSRLLDFTQAEFPSIDSLVEVLDCTNLFLRKNGNNELFVSGYIWYGTGSMDSKVTMKRGYMLAKFDSKLSLIWTKITSDYYTNDYIVTKDFQIDNEGNIFLVGILASQDPSVKRNQIIKINGGNGELINKSILIGDLNKLFLGSLKITTQNEIIISGSFQRYLQEYDREISKYYISKFDSDLNQVWEILNTSRDSNDTSILEAIEIDPNRYFAYGGYLSSIYKSDFYGIEILDKQNGISLKSNNVFDYQIQQTNDQLVIEIKSIEISEMNISISDLSGRIVFQKRIDKAPEHIEKINLSLFTNGVYLINISNGNQSISKKIPITK